MEFTEEKLIKEIDIVAKALNKNPVDFVSALCAASGEIDIDKIRSCQNNLDNIIDKLRNFENKDQRKTLENIYQFYNSGKWNGNKEISFPKSVDNFVNPNIDYIGNCVNRTAIFYIIANKLEVQVGLTSSFLEEHVSIRTLDKNPIIIDLNCGFDQPRYEDEEDISFRNLLGIYYLNRVQETSSPFEKAQLCRGTLSLSPDRYEGYSELATIHLEYGGNLDVAINLLKKSLFIKDNLISRANLALAYNKMGRKDLANIELKKIGKISPNFEHLLRLEEIIN